MILKFSANIGLLQNASTYIVLPPIVICINSKNGGNITYGELLKQKEFATKLVCIWQSSLKNDSKYCIIVRSLFQMED